MFIYYAKSSKFILKQDCANIANYPITNIRSTKILIINSIHHNWTILFSFRAGLHIDLAGSESCSLSAFLYENIVCYLLKISSYLDKEMLADNGVGDTNLHTARCR